MEQQIETIILNLVQEFNGHGGHHIAAGLGAKTPLYGHDGGLDSLGLVSFIIALEQALQDELGLSITLADEKAMSQKNSPFRTVETLTDYIARKAVPAEGQHER